MSLMQLLAVGRSIRTIQDRPTPYRMVQQNLLPRFGAVPGSSQKAQGGQAWPLRRSGQDLAPAPSPKNGMVPASAGEPRASARRWFRWGRGKEVGRKNPGPIQGELALNSVRVVRNDLSESDLEVVPAREREPEPGGTPASGRPGGHWAERLWRGWLGRRMLRERRA